MGVYENLADAFGTEWQGLSYAERTRIADDAADAADAADAYREDGCGVRQYRTRIGLGNLRSYLAWSPEIGTV
jgi:hypothetical protein